MKILILILFLISCAPQMMSNRLKAYSIAGNIVGENTPATERHRMESSVKQILKNLQEYPDSEKIAINSLFISFQPGEINTLKRELRGHIKPGKPTDPLKETAGNLKEIFRHLGYAFDQYHILDLKELLIKK